MNTRWRPALLAVALVLCSSPVARTAAQAAPPPEPGAAATPGQSNPDRSDPSTATPSTINRSPPGPTARDSSSPSSDPDMSATTERTPKEAREARLGGISAGTQVRSPAGEAIGRVKDIVPNSSTGEPDYIIITTRSGSTAVPYTVIALMYQNGHVVLDKSRLESAPHVRDSQLQDKSDATWRKEADRYWESQNPARLR
jgi:hypothetical protein